jgi:hypothetical protein
VLKFRKGIVKFYANVRDVDYVLSAYKKINTHCCPEFVTQDFSLIIIVYKSVVTDYGQQYFYYFIILRIARGKSIKISSSHFFIKLNSYIYSGLRHHRVAGGTPTMARNRGQKYKD